MKHITLTTILAFSIILALGQSKPKHKQTHLDSTLSTFVAASGTGTLVYTGANAIKYDTVTCYFREILDVKNGELVTQWVRGWRVQFATENYNGHIFYQPTDILWPYLYPDKKTRVTNKIIQEY